MAPLTRFLSGFTAGPPEILGQTLVKDAVTYTPWIEAQGEAVTIAIQTFGRSTNGTLTVAVQHKNHDQTDAQATTEATTIVMNSVTVSRQRYTGLRRLLRLKFTGGGSDTLDWTHFRALNPAWERNGLSVVGAGFPIVPQSIVGVTLFKGLTVFGPWSHRLGNNVTHLVRAIAINGATLTVTIQHKAATATDDAGNISDLSNTIVVSAVGVVPARNVDVKELWRYKYVVTGADAHNWIVEEVLSPQWEVS